jgi:hypothetical protein
MGLKDKTLILQRTLLKTKLRNEIVLFKDKR